MKSKMTSENSSRNQLIMRMINSIFFIGLLFSSFITHAQTWNTLGTEGFSAGDVYYTSLAYDGNTPYVAYFDNGNAGKGMLKKFDGTNWITVGSGPYSSDAALFNSLAFNGSTPYVAFRDDANGLKATVKKFDGTNWVVVGNAGFSAGQADYTSLAFDGNTPYVAYMDYNANGKISVKKFDGVNWVTVGSAGFSVGIATFIDLVFNGSTPYVAFRDQLVSGKAIVKKFNGTNWENVGSPSASPNVASHISLAFNGSNPSIAFKGVTSVGQTTKLQGTSWVPEGTSAFNLSTANYISLIYLGSVPYVAYSDGMYSNRVVVKRFDGADWVAVGALGFSTLTAEYISFATNGSKLCVAYRDFGAVNKLTVKQFDLPCQTTASTINQTICQGGSYSFNGISQTTTGTYLDTFVNATGCDSMVTLYLTVTPQPTMPSLACYETATFNATTCSWDVTGTQPAMPTGLACYEVATFNTTSCAWEVTGVPNPLITTTANVCGSYVWNVNNQTYSSPGVYNYTSNCQDYELILTVNASPMVSTMDAVICPNGSVNLSGTPAGGTFSVANPYSGSATAFTYSYTSGNGCTASATGNVINASVLPAEITTPIAVATTHATISWTPVPGSTIYYVWYRKVGSLTWLSPSTAATTLNLTGLSPNSLYEVKIRNNNANCNMNGLFGGVVNFTTTNEPCGTATTFSNVSLVPNNKIKFVWNTALGTAQYSIWYKLTTATSWSTALFSGSVNTMTTATLAPGTYEYKIRNRCNGSTTFTSFGASGFFTIGTESKGDDFVGEGVMKMFPNPTSNLLNIEWTSNQSGNTWVNIFDMTGRLIKQVQANTSEGINQLEIDLSTCAKGVYTVQVVEDGRLTHTNRVTKKD